MAGGQMNSTEMVDNYPGFPEPVFGSDLAQKMEVHAKRFGLEVQYGEVAGLERGENGFTVETVSGNNYVCRALIVATGAQPVKLGIPGEEELIGRGVSYCAVCDGPFFQDREVAVIGGGDAAVEEAVYMTRFASKVHLIHRRDELRAVKEIQVKAFAEPKITIHWSNVPLEIKGDDKVSSLKLRSVKDQTETDLHVGGVFFYVGLKPNAAGLEGMLETDSAGFIITDETMATSVPGIFACGDVMDPVYKQAVTSGGTGCIAALDAQKYLEE
jgi:thioredoxin reductase (NADPH)